LSNPYLSLSRRVVFRIETSLAGMKDSIAGRAPFSTITCRSNRPHGCIFASGDVMNSEAYLKSAAREFTRLHDTANKAIEQLRPEQIFINPDHQSNSIAVIMKHLAGNMKSRWTDFLTSDGEKADRNRDGEFEIHSDDSYIHIVDGWNKGWQCLFDALSGMKPEQAEAVVVIRGESFSAMEAINRQLTHVGQHVGQIVYLAKMMAGLSWRSLSIPRGGSKEFNKNPVPYKA
jgi:hypothetical protein